MALLFQEPVWLFVAEDHPLAGKEHLHYSDLAGCGFAFPHDDCLFVIEMLRRIREKQVDIGKTSYLGGVQLVLEQVMKNRAIALMPRSAVERVQENNRVSCLMMEEEPLLVWETLIYKDYDMLKPAARNLLRYCINDAQNRPGN
jgi:DNA-binding transcriptional LysR family regulator